jgi:ligand-binding SRPBCC domain-containing protein
VVERSIEIDVPVERLFRFHLDTRNAPIVSPPDARVVSVEGTFPVTEGSVVELAIRTPPIPKPHRWRVRIDAVVPNKAIVDVGLKSKPFAAWRHEHRFESIGRDRSRLTDRIAYRLPGPPPAAAMMNRLIVAKKLTRSLEGRQRNTKTYLERPR